MDEDYWAGVIEPSQLNDIQPKVVVIKDTLDPHMWARRQASKDLGIPEEELADEPDCMADHSDDQGFDLEEE